MKKFPIILLIIVSTNFCKGQVDNGLQTSSSPTKNQFTKKGTMYGDAFFGTPYLWGYALKIAADSLKQQGNTVANFHNYQQWGLNYEYMVNEQLGFGVEYTYALASFDYLYGATKYSTIGLRKQRILGKMSLHFARSSRKWDPYLNVGIGYSTLKMYDQASAKTINLSDSSAIVPLAIRVGFGFRYFFNDFLGINAEVGIGGPIAHVGLSFRF